MYKELKTIFHQSPDDAERIYSSRVSDASAVRVELTQEHTFFYLMVNDVYKKLLEAERLDRQIEAVASTLPDSAVNRYMQECLIDEIVLTNDIEGVVSTRQQIERALDALKRNDKRQRFQGIVDKYGLIASGESTPLENCEDLRVLYDDLVLEEVIRANAGNAPDGKLFRKEPVSVVDAAQRVIHTNAYSEAQIEDAVRFSLELLEERNEEPLILAAVFHFLFGFIHPFIDGNGRTNRFITGYFISRRFSRFAGMRLSFSIKENIRAYYKAFQHVEHPLNRGDLTPFIISFLNIVVDGLKKTWDALSDKASAHLLAQETLDGLLYSKGLEGSRDVGNLLVEAGLFTESGVSADEIAEACKISTPTAYKNLNRLRELGILERRRIGRRALYKIPPESLHAND